MLNIKSTKKTINIKLENIKMLEQKQNLTDREKLLLKNLKIDVERKK